MYIVKKISLYFAISILLSVTFWLIGFLMWSGLSTSRHSSSEEGIARAEQERMYMQQLSETEKQLRVSASQQQRMDELLSRQEKQADRYEAILKKWESNGFR